MAGYLRILRCGCFTVSKYLGKYVTLVLKVDMRK